MLTIIKTVLKDAIYYPSDDWMKVVILGFLSLISFIGILTVLNVFTLLCLVILPLPLGYLFKIIKSSFQGSDELPDFVNWKNMYVDGIKVIVTLLIYAIPIILLFLIFNWGFFLNITNISLLTLWQTLLNSVIQIVIFILIGFIELTAIANMALYEGEISAAFRFKEIFKRISGIGLKNYLLFYAIVWGIGIITILLSLVALTFLIGIIIIPLLIAPYFIIVSTRLLALIFAYSEA